MIDAAEQMHVPMCVCVCVCVHERYELPSRARIWLQATERVNGYLLHDYCCYYDYYYHYYYALLRLLDCQRAI